MLPIVAEISLDNEVPYENQIAISDHPASVRYIPLLRG
jgi:hypothetical protein